MKIIFVFIYILSFLLVIPLGFWVYRSKRKLWKSIVSGCLLLALLSSIFVYQQHQNLTSITADKLLSKNVTNFIYDGDKSKTVFYALDINTGKILWKNQIVDPYARFVLSNGIIYMTNFRNLEAIRETDGTLIWMKETTDSYFQFADLVLYRDVLFVTTSQVGTEGFFCLALCPVTQRIYAIAAEDGVVKWQYHPSVVSASEGFIHIGTN